eukprot:9568172-Heterocapsa_arctica.AAC.1
MPRAVFGSDHEQQWPRAHHRAWPDLRAAGLHGALSGSDDGVTRGEIDVFTSARAVQVPHAWRTEDTTTNGASSRAAVDASDGASSPYLAQRRLHLLPAGRSTRCTCRSLQEAEVPR